MLLQYRKEERTLAKETKLDDSAGIYAKRTKQTEREKVKDMTFKERVAYFNMYYLKKVVISICIIGILGSLLYQTLAPKPDELLNIAVINDYFDDKQINNFLNNLNTHFEVDPDKEKINFDYSYYISDSDMSQNTVSSIQKLSTYVAAKQLDVIITDEACFKSLTEDGYFISLTDLLPVDVYTELVDRFYTGAVKEDDLKGNISYGPQETYGIYIDDSEIYKNSGTSIEKPVLGVISNSPNKDNTIKLIKYLLELK